MKNLIKKLREKLELDNSERYVDGKYIMSLKQKILWVFVLFIISFICSLVKASLVIEGAKYSWSIIIFGILTNSFLLNLFSLAVSSPFFLSRKLKFLPSLKENISDFALFQVLTVIHLALIIIFIF